MNKQNRVKEISKFVVNENKLNVLNLLFSNNVLLNSLIKDRKFQTKLDATIKIRVNVNINFTTITIYFVYDSSTMLESKKLKRQKQHLDILWQFDIFRAHKVDGGICDRVNSNQVKQRRCIQRSQAQIKTEKELRENKRNHVTVNRQIVW